VRLTSLKLSGFKSFVEPTTFDVPGQLVGVVGPNGCGKSNIIDAVRWVLGESKASELRGESMQDVIFNGTTHRKAAGRASVELLFNNDEGKASGEWGQYAEISVKRTLTRDGTSTYYINNQVVRRRDIQDIFLGTGLGPRAYAIIGQGMISRIIEARPEDLRIFLEEAAGISKYKERRRETENRLNDTRENLLRVEDILRELNVNLEKLEKQAAIATQFREMEHDQDEKQKLLWLLRKNEATVEQQKFFREMEKAQTALEEETAKLRHVESGLEQMRQDHYRVGDQVHQAQGFLYQTNSEIGSLEAQIRYVVESRTRLESQINALKTQRDQWLNQKVQFEGSIAESELALAECSESKEMAEIDLQQYNNELPVIEQSWRDAQSSTTESRSKIMQLQQRMEVESAHQKNAASALTSLAIRRDRLLQEFNGLTSPDPEEYLAKKTDSEKNSLLLKDAIAKQKLAQQEQPKNEDLRRREQIQLSDEKSKYARLDAQISTLKQLQARVQTEGKVQPWLNKNNLDSLPRLWQNLKIKDGWESAIESALRERTAALHIPKLEMAENFFAEAPPAKLAIFTTDILIENIENRSTDLVPLMSLLKIDDAILNGVIEEWLHHIYVAEDVSTVFVDRNKLPYGAHFITKEGHLIGKSSVRFYAQDTVQDGMLARQQEIDSIEKQLLDQQKIIESTSDRLAIADKLFCEGVASLHMYRSEVEALTQLLHSLQIDILKLTELQTRSSERSGQINIDLNEISDQEREHAQIKEESEGLFEQYDNELITHQQSHEENYAFFLKKEEDLTKARERLRDFERLVQEQDYAEKSLRNKMEELHRNINTAKEQIGQISTSLEQACIDCENINDEADQESLQNLLETRHEHESALSDAREELDQLTQNLRKFDEARALSERSMQPHRDKIVEFQLKEQAARLSQDQYSQQLIDAEADEVALTEKLSGDLKASHLQSEVTRLNNAIAALGAVNLAALDELAASTERKTFLDAQFADLTLGINTLQDAITCIDKETRDLLQETFDKVNLHFAELFPILFGGGNAKLVMTGDEILDSGVQVMAQPPGKKNATIHLLSGGEKALTATALVFSMFQLNPAPFCLLDEVDAPLDDSNTERFCNMVKRMSEHTQFLFISHNKIAMEMAHQLIGVTMQEQGVSRIVAVDMEKAVSFAS
jgi:chromosome segregation protein